MLKQFDNYQFTGLVREKDFYNILFTGLREFNPNSKDWVVLIRAIKSEVRERRESKQTTGLFSLYTLKMLKSQYPELQYKEWQYIDVLEPIMLPIILYKGLIDYTLKSNNIFKITTKSIPYVLEILLSSKIEDMLRKIVAAFDKWFPNYWDANLPDNYLIHQNLDKTHKKEWIEFEIFLNKTLDLVDKKKVSFVANVDEIKRLMQYAVPREEQVNITLSIKSGTKDLFYQFVKQNKLTIESAMLHLLYNMATAKQDEEDNG